MSKLNGMPSMKAERRVTGTLREVSPATPKKKASETFRSVRPLLMDLVRPRRGKLALGFGLMLINIAMSVVLPGAPRYLLDNIIAKGQHYLLTPLVLIVFWATIIQGVTSFSLTQLLSKEGQRLIAQLRRTVRTWGANRTR